MRQYGLRIKVVRIFNTHGPRMQPNDGRVVSNFIVQALKVDDITIHGDGRQTRGLCYVDDMIEAMTRMMDTEDDFTGPVNIGNPEEYAMLEFAEKIIRLTASRSRLIFRVLPPDDPKLRQPDIALARRKLDWQPVAALNEGLKNTIEAFRETLRQSSA